MTKRILVVDDSPLVRHTEETLLTQAGYQVAVAAGGLEAIEKMQASTYNLVLTDLNMPDLDGFAVLKHVKNSAKHRFTPVVMITSETQEEKRREGKSSGAVGWIVKPFTEDQLLTVVRRVLG